MVAGRLISLMFALMALGTAQSGSSAQSPKFNVTVNLVSIDAEVLDRSASPVTGLSKDDFVVKEDGKVVKITNFARLRHRPVSLAILLDKSFVSLEQFDVAKQFVFRLIHLLGHKDQIAIFTFDIKGAYLEQDFTKDRGLLVSTLDNLSVPSSGTNNLLLELLGPPPETAIAIDTARLDLMKTNYGRKALLVISNQFRGLGPVTVRHIEDSGCSVLTLGFSDPTAMLLSLGGDQISRIELTQLSGGAAFSAEHSDITRVCHSIARSLKNYYALAYVTTAGSDRSKPRHIEVSIPGHDYVINARRTYLPDLAKSS